MTWAGRVAATALLFWPLVGAAQDAATDAPGDGAEPVVDGAQDGAPMADGAEAGADAAPEAAADAAFNPPPDEGCQCDLRGRAAAPSTALFLLLALSLGRACRARRAAGRARLRR
jgi:hypothetical protein